MTYDDKLASERLRGRVEYWKQIAAIQIHFNDMCIRTRWLGLTAIATLVAAAAIAEKEDIRFSLSGEWMIGLPSVLMTISLMLLTALWFLDIHYYYKMLIASVEYGERFEKQIIPDLQVDDDGITSYISQKISRRRAWFVSRMFYILVGAVLLIFLASSFLPQHRLTSANSKEGPAFERSETLLWGF
jgi:hypothetical protein